MPPTPHQLFTARLRRALKRAGITQALLAKRLGIDRSAVCNWLGGRSIPKGEYLLQMPDILNVDGHWLLTGRGPIGQRASMNGQQTALDIDMGYQAAIADFKRVIEEMEKA